MIRTEFTEDRDVLVVFTLEADAGRGTVSVVGDFNGWDPYASPLMTSADDPSIIEAAIRCEPGCRYEFRYLSDAIGWFNDVSAAEFCLNPHGGYNGVLYAPTAPESGADVDLRETDSATLLG